MKRVEPLIDKCIIRVYLWPIHSGSEQVIQQFVWGQQYIDELVQVGLNDDPNDATEDDVETFRYAMHNANFNVQGLVDDSGALIERYEYTPYGERQVYISAGLNDPDCYAPIKKSKRFQVAGVDQPWGVNPVGHQGLFHDEETRLVNNRYRMRHPRLGRFMQRDPLGYIDGANFYQYISSNPLKGTDSYGLATISIGIGGDAQVGPIAIGGSADINVGVAIGDVSASGTVTFGGGPGLGLGVGEGFRCTISTADNVSDLLGWSDVYGINTPIGSLEFGGGSDYYLFSISGLGFWEYDPILGIYTYRTWTHQVPGLGFGWPHQIGEGWPQIPNVGSEIPWIANNPLNPEIDLPGPGYNECPCPTTNRESVDWLRLWRDSLVQNTYRPLNSPLNPLFHLLQQLSHRIGSLIDQGNGIIPVGNDPVQNPISFR